MRFPALLLVAASALSAHVGSPDIYYDGAAGPYRLAVTIRPPQVIPGVAEIEIRSQTPGVRQVQIVPVPISGPGAKYAPTPDIAARSKADPQFFTGTLWIMRGGSWRVQITAAGDGGSGALSVPVPALSLRTLQMQTGMGLVLLPLLVVLTVGLVSIVGAGVREAQLKPGDTADPRRRVRSRIAMAATAAIILLALWFGNQWWDSEAGWYARIVFKPIQLTAQVESGDRLRLNLTDPGWLNRKLDDFIPDHNHLMHLYVIRLPGMERVWHLHPEQQDPGAFLQQLPPMPAGRYQLFGDLVHSSGLPETVVAAVDLPEIKGQALTGDDAAGEGPLLAQADPTRTVAPLPDGGRMVWERDPGPLHTRQLLWFRFRVDDASGQPARDLEMYMGMPGHAAFVRTDLSVFAHVHPSGSVPMAALALAQPSADPMSMHAMHMAHELPPCRLLSVRLPPTRQLPDFCANQARREGADCYIRCESGELGKLGSLKDKGVLITGAGRGIGKRLALGFAHAGARVGLLARSQPELDLAKLEIEDAGGSALRIRADVRDFEQMTAAADRMLAVFGGVHVLIAAAAIQGPIGPLVETKPKDWAEVIGVNLLGAMCTCRAVLPQMIERRSGKIILLSGGGAANPRANFSAYAASKTAVVRMAETLAEEVRDYNVQVNCMAPGGSYTHMTDEIIHAAERAGRKEIEDAEHVRLTGGVSPEKQVQLALFLASERSNHVSGKLIHVNDDWKRLERENTNPELFTLRRVSKLAQ